MKRRYEEIRNKHHGSIRGITNIRKHSPHTVTDRGGFLPDVFESPAQRASLRRSNGKAAGGATPKSQIPPPPRRFLPWVWSRELCAPHRFYVYYCIFKSVQVITPEILLVFTILLLEQLEQQRLPYSNPAPGLQILWVFAILWGKPLEQQSLPCSNPTPSLQILLVFIILWGKPLKY